MNTNHYSKRISTNSIITLGDTITRSKGNFWCKNPRGEYFGIGETFVQFSGLDSADAITGKTDFQMPWGDTAHLLFKNDCEAMQLGRIKIDEEPILNAAKDFVIFLVAKLPIYNLTNEILGTLGCSIPLISKNNDLLLPQSQLQLQHDESSSHYSDDLFNLSNELFLLISTITENNFQQYLNSNKIYLKINGQKIAFTKRELQCLAHLFLGKSAKETASIYKLSQKTVEYYLKNIKMKLNCYNRAQIVDLIIKNNLMYKLLQLVAI